MMAEATTALAIINTFLPLPGGNIAVRPGNPLIINHGFPWGIDQVTPLTSFDGPNKSSNFISATIWVCILRICLDGLVFRLKRLVLECRHRRWPADLCGRRRAKRFVTVHTALSAQV
jgi:hypothetical protein